MTGWEYRGGSEIARRLGKSKGQVSNLLKAGTMRKVLGDRVVGITNDDLVRILPIIKLGWYNVADALVEIRRNRAFKIPKWRELIRDARVMLNEDDAMIALRGLVDRQFEFVVALEHEFLYRSKPQQTWHDAIKRVWFKLHGEMRVVSDEDRDRKLANGWTIKTSLPDGMILIDPPTGSLVAAQPAAKTADERSN